MSRSPSLPPYFRPEMAGVELYTLEEREDCLRLHQNEGFPLSEELATQCADVVSQAFAQDLPLNRYPHLSPEGLRAAYAEALGIGQENVEVTLGSSQAIDLLALACFAPGRRVAILGPTFSLYEATARLHGATIVPLELGKRFQPVQEALLCSQALDADVVMLCTPNNPTGGLVPFPWIEELVSKARGLVVVDEAYFEFAAPKGKAVSALTLLGKYENLVVLRTLSKAWGGAGLRVGALASNPRVVTLFRALRPPYSIPTPTEVLAVHLLRHQSAELARRVALTLQERRILEEGLARVDGIEVFPGDANFVFFRVGRSHDLARHLLDTQRMCVRAFSKGRLQGCLRANVWLPDDNRRFLAAVQEFLR